MRVALVDYDGRLTNPALCKLSTWHKMQGHEVVLNPTSPAGLDKTYVSLIFSSSKEGALAKYGDYPDVTFGGTGYSLHVELPEEVEFCRPDYSLYTVDDIYARIKRRPGKKENAFAKAQEIVDAAIFFIYRGCVNDARLCQWCCVPAKEGRMKRVTHDISSMLNPRSNRMILLDNSLLAAPDALDILKELAERKLVVDITQGFDIRRLTPELALALSKVRHWRSLHYSWDITKAEKSVFNGIGILSEFIAKSRQLCYILCGFNTTFEEDMARVRKLTEAGVRPFIMVYRPLEDFVEPSAKTDYARIRLQHLKRWVNAPRAIFRTVPFERYENWVNAQAKLAGAVGASQLDLCLA